MTADLTHDELQIIFSDPNAAREHLEKIRWANGVVCPHCGAKDEYTKLEPREGGKAHVRQGVYKCNACRKQFTVTVGTIFEDSHIPLNKWLHVFHLVCSSKKGMSAHQIHRTIGVTYKSAWFMVHRIRWAMEQRSLEKMDGTIEVDETYVGGKNKGGKQGHGLDNKTPVVVVLTRDGESRATKMERVTSENLKNYIGENVEKSAHVNTDGSPLYKGQLTDYASHEVVDHKKGEYVRGKSYTNNAESWFALLKRGVVGTFHHVSRKHLNRYANEFAFRWTYRKVTDYERTIATIRIVGGKRLMYKDLIAKE